MDEAVQDIGCLLHICEAMGCEVRRTAKGIYLKSCRRLLSVEDIHTRPFPGFPTDMQSQMMAVLSTAGAKAEFMSISLKTVSGQPMS